MKMILCVLSTALACVFAPGNFALAAAAVGVLLAAVLGGRIARRMESCAERIRRIADGDFHGVTAMPFPEDETGRMAHAVRDLAAGLGRMTRSTARLLDETASGLRMREKDYPGDFARVGEAAVRAYVALGDKAQKLGQEAGRTADDARQAAAGAQALCRSADRQSEAAGESAQAAVRLAARVRQDADEARKAARELPGPDSEAARIAEKWAQSAAGQMAAATCCVRESSRAAGMARAHAAAAERFAVRTERLGEGSRPTPDTGPRQLGGTSITYTVDGDA